MLSVRFIIIDMGCSVMWQGLLAPQALSTADDMIPINQRRRSCESVCLVILPRYQSLFHLTPVCRAKLFLARQLRPRQPRRVTPWQDNRHTLGKSLGQGGRGLMYVAALLMYFVSLTGWSLVQVVTAGS